MKLLESLEEEFVLMEGKYNIIEIDHVPDNGEGVDEPSPDEAGLGEARSTPEERQRKAEEKRKKALQAALKDTHKMIDHDINGIRTVNAYVRRELLRQGWQDAVGIEKFDDEGKYCQLDVDPRDLSQWTSQGWKVGHTNMKMVRPDGTYCYVTPDVYDKKLAKGWRDYKAVLMSKPIKLKDGRDDFDNIQVEIGDVEAKKAEGYVLGWQKTKEYYETFSIMTSNSKLGHVANFSLTPVETCPASVPCKDDGCYAKISYNQYPDVKLAWDKNTKLIKEHPEWLVRDVDNFLQKGPGKKLNKFRWHVAGDLISDAHLQSIIQIAKDNPGVLFWLYTKNYDLVAKYKGQNPSNLVIILSAWNGYRLKEIEAMHKDFPVAYLDDNMHKDLIPSDEEAYICPCSDDKVGDMVDDKHCETCKTHSERLGNTETHPCYMLRPGESLIFRKH